jgi:hypothetical protein
MAKRHLIQSAGSHCARATACEASVDYVYAMLRVLLGEALLVNNMCVMLRALH